MSVYLRKINSDKNQYRFYSLHITPTLFGGWALVREWGRIGAGGRMQSDWFDTEEEAVKALESVEKQKRGKGYS